jgi:hypothetical protein
MRVKQSVDVVTATGNYAGRNASAQAVLTGEQPAGEIQPQTRRLCAERVLPAMGATQYTSPCTRAELIGVGRVRRRWNVCGWNAWVSCLAETQTPVSLDTGVQLTVTSLRVLFFVFVTQATRIIRPRL